MWWSLDILLRINRDLAFSARSSCIDPLDTLLLHTLPVFSWLKSSDAIIVNIPLGRILDLLSFWLL